MSYKLKEYTKKEQIIIWICTIILIILSFIGIATISGILTKKIVYVKAEETTKYKITAPPQLSTNFFNSLTTVGDMNTTNIHLFESTYNGYDYTITAIYQSNYAIGIKFFEYDNGQIVAVAVLSYVYQGDPHNYNTTVISGNPNHIIASDIAIMEWEMTEYMQNYIQNNNVWVDKWNIIFQEVIPETIQLNTPTLTINLNTLHWEQIENAEYYNIFQNGNLIGQTQNTQWVTIENGIYTVQACTTQEGYSNSELSNSITQNNYNDLIGNGTNWFTFFSAFVDSQIYLMKSMLNYTIWDINFFQLFTFIITIILTVFIIKFIKGW